LLGGQIGISHKHVFFDAACSVSVRIHLLSLFQRQCTYGVFISLLSECDSRTFKEGTARFWEIVGWNAFPSWDKNVIVLCALPGKIKAPLLQVELISIIYPLKIM
jgi:hypothetical protein